MRTTISILVCTRDRCDSLRETLTSLAGVVSRLADLEIAVINNGSADRTSDIIAEARATNPCIVEVFEGGVGQTLARNAGVRHARGEVLLWTDDDVRVRPDWADRLAGPILRGEADVTCGPVRMAPHLVRPWQTMQHRRWLAAYDEPAEGEGPTVIGANMAFHRRVLERVPAFDPELGPGQLGYGDETLFSLQAAKASFRTVHVPEVEVEHHFDLRRLSRASWLKAARSYGRSNAYLCHHWYHDRVPLPRLQISKARMRLATHRVRHGKPPDEGISETEMNLRCYLHFCEHFLAIRGQPRKYEKFGLRKLAI